MARTRKALQTNGQMGTDGNTDGRLLGRTYTEEKQNMSPAGGDI